MFFKVVKAAIKRLSVRGRRTFGDASFGRELCERAKQTPTAPWKRICFAYQTAGAYTGVAFDQYNGDSSEARLRPHFYEAVEFPPSAYFE